MSALLQVEKSATGRRWLGLSEQQDRISQAISQQSGLSYFVSRTLARRGISAQDAQAFLSPTLRDLMPNPSHLLDMDKAAARLVHAINSNQRIAIFADYDVDGAASAALLVSWLRDLGRQATVYVPDRIDEGYGPNNAAMGMLAKDHDLIICVDCGTLSYEPILAADGTDVIVLDHHLGGETLPKAHAIVNPNRQDETSEFGYLCAAGVVFMTLAACNRVLKNSGTIAPNLIDLLDLVALATVADVAPLVGFNRALVRQGLSVMARRNRPGLVALADAAGMNTAPSSYHLGFLLGPRINAGGRVGKADLGARLLSTTDKDEAISIADRLEQLNKERREIEATVQLQAMEQAEARGLDRPLVWAAGKNWHPGVVGIVASRIKEITNRPAVIIGIDGAEAKGSGRSVSGIDLGSAVATCVREGLLSKGGGHQMAAGLSAATDKIDAAMERLSEILAKQGANELGPADIFIDSVITPSAITIDLIEQLEQTGPFGPNAAAPRFALPAQRIAFAKRAGDTHLRLTLQGENGGRIDAICFRAFDGPVGDILENHQGKQFHCVGRLEIDDWGGRRKAKLRLEDIAEV